MFSNTLSRWKIEVIWKLRDRPSRLMRCGGSPSSRVASSRISPEVIGNRPLIRLNSVVLPAPFGPISAWRSPAATFMLTPRMISVWPKFLVTSVSDSDGGLIARHPAHDLDQAVPDALEVPRLARQPDAAAQQAGQRNQPRHRRCRCRSRWPNSTRRLPCAMPMVRNDSSSTRPTKPNSTISPGTQDAQIRQRQPAQQAGARDRRVLQDDAGEAGRREGHHGDEQHADIDQPGVRHQADAALQQRDQDRAEHRAEERGGAADIGHQQRVRRQRRGDRIEGDDLVGDGEQPAADAGIEAGQRELQEAHDARIVADELRALVVVAAGIRHAAERRRGVEIHADRRDHHPGHDQVIDLDRLARIPGRTGCCRSRGRS